MLSPMDASCSVDERLRVRSPQYGDVDTPCEKGVCNGVKGGLA